MRPGSELARLQDAAQKQTTDLRTQLTERIDLWLNATRPVLKVSIARFICSSARDGGCIVSIHAYNHSDRLVASLYCWEKRLFRLADVEVEADNEGRILAIECLDDEWTLDYEMPPLKIMQIRLAGVGGSTRLMDGGLLSREVDGTCWELDETGEPPAFGLLCCLNARTPT